MKLADIRGIAKAQKLARAAIHDAADTVRPGDREIDVARRIEERLERAGVRNWLHTAYVWWGERTRFGGFVDWEPDALPTERRLAEGEAFILDVAPLVDGYPADYAISGWVGEGGETHAAATSYLARLKDEMVAAARAHGGNPLFGTVGRNMVDAGYDPIHPLYPGGVLGHVVARIPWPLSAAPRLGDGFQLPIVGAYAGYLARHALGRGDYPFLNEDPRSPTRGLFAVEPHLASGPVGVKFESILLIDGDETRWLDPGLFGEVTA